jgi:hypothetical protein
MKLFHKLCVAAIITPLIGNAVQAEIASNAIRIGVLTDLSGGYEQNSGNGVVEATRMAAEDEGGFLALAHLCDREDGCLVGGEWAGAEEWNTGPRSISHVMCGDDEDMLKGYA